FEGVSHATSHATALAQLDRQPKGRLLNPSSRHYIPKKQGISSISMMDPTTCRFGGHLMMLHCLFAMVLAAATLGVLHCFGFMVRSSNCCPVGQGYTTCEMWQDFRSMLSFFLGALLCCLVTRNDKTSEEDPMWSAWVGVQL
ncbi:unnamed protein product, partial [Effrenium voratum]